MSRLPKQGGDNGNWGNILNDFLVQSHNPSGTLRDGTVGSSQIQDSAITASKLSTPVNTYLASAQTAVQTVNGKSGTDVSIGVGDLSEAADAADGQALVKNGSTWSPVSVVSGALTPGTIDAKDARGNPTQITDGGVVSTYTWWLGDGTIPDDSPKTETSLGKTKTFIYASGVLTSWTVA